MSFADFVNISPSFYKGWILIFNKYLNVLFVAFFNFERIEFLMLCQILNLISDENKQLSHFKSNGILFTV